MRRRKFLAGAATIPLFGGCLSASGDLHATQTTSDEGTRATMTTTSVERGGRPAATENVRMSFDEDAHEQFDRFTVGDGVETDGRKPHDVVVWNDGPERAIDVLVRGEGESPTFDRRLTFPANEYLRLKLTERVEYLVAVGVDGKPEYDFDLSDGLVDCNSSKTTVRVAENGQVSYVTVSTAMACLTPE